MNTWIWKFVSDDGRHVTYRHASKTFRIPRVMLVAIPPLLTDSQVADLKAAYGRDKERINA